MKIKKGDNVKVMAGKDKGKTGTILHAYPRTNQVVIDGVNVKTIHQKSNRRGSRGQVIERPAPIDVSNVSIIVDGKPQRVGYQVEGEGKDAKKVRVARPSGKKI